MNEIDVVHRILTTLAAFLSAEAKEQAETHFQN